jgi:Rrf2 family protein
MIPKRSKYAIKALTALAKVYRDKQHLSIATIAEQENIPRKFLEAILLQLRNEGMVNSKMGASGGYYLVKHPDEIMLSAIIRSTGGPIALIPCVSLNFYEECVECPHEELCGLHEVMLEVREASIHILSKTSLADLILREKKLFRKSENSRR